MSDLRMFSLSLCECVGITSEDDLVGMLELITPLGLALGIGSWGYEKHPNPTEDIRGTLAESHMEVWRRLWPGAKSRPTDPLKQTETWGRALLRVEQPDTFANVGIVRRGDDQWDVFFAVSPDAYHKSGLTIDKFSDGWGELLEMVGDVLYPRLRPVIALITAPRKDESLDFTRPVIERRLSVGWRTWFGPTFGERYGNDWIRGLPDRTRDLDDGGVRQAFDASALDLISGQDVYARVWPYLDQAGVEPYWPRRRRRGSAPGPKLTAAQHA